MPAWRVQTRFLYAAAVLATVAALVCTVACDEQRAATRSSGCDDSVKPSDHVPRDMRGQGLEGVGSGDVWFIAPDAGRWSESLTVDPEKGRVGKYPLWVDTSRRPTVAVEGTQGTEGTGTAELAPTSGGLPGPLPVGVAIPAPGCWQITAQGQSGSASIVVKAP